jgi:hypothetical protein
MMTPAPIIENQPLLMEVWHLYGGTYPAAESVKKTSVEGAQTISIAPPINLTPEDEIVIQRIMQSEKCAPEFQLLGNAECFSQKGDYPSESEVDLALVGTIACFTSDSDQIERIWLSTPQGQREKTRTRPEYRRKTILKVLEEDFPLVEIVMVDSAAQSEGPQPLRRQLPPPPPFPIEALGNLLSQAAGAIIDIIQCPAAMAGVSLLEAASLAVQAHADVVIPATGHVKPLSLFALSIAKSGERKTAADYQALAPVRLFQEEMYRFYESEKFLHANKLAAWKSECAKINADKKAGFEAKVAALNALGPEPEAPLTPIFISDEPTYSGMCLLYETGFPMLGIFSDEGGQFVGGYGMKEDNKLNTAAALSNLWDGKPITRVRRGDKPLIMPGKRLAVHLMVQPEVAAVFLSDGMLKGQGLLSRYLLSFPESTIGTRLQRPCAPNSRTTLNQYTAHLLAILRRKPQLAPGTINQLMPRTLMLDATAVSYWIAFADDVERKTKAGCEYEQISGFANKASEHALRIAGVITLFENIEAQVIPLHILEKAIALTYYFISEALRLVDSGMVSPALRKAELLLQWLHTKWDEEYIGTTVLTQSGPNSMRSKSDVMSAIDILVNHGWLFPAGRPVVNGIKVKQGWRVIRNAAANPANSANQVNSGNSDTSGGHKEK